MKVQQQHQKQAKPAQHPQQQQQQGQGQGKTMLIPRKVIEDYSYNMNEIIGTGYSSSVFKGKDDRNNDLVAVKVIDMKGIKNEVQKFLLQNEIEIIKKLKNYNLLETKDVFQTQNNTYIITELCNHGDLKELLAKYGKLSESAALKILRHIINGLKELIQKNIIHRDLKPANVLLKDGVPKICDFGFSQDLKAPPCKFYYNVGTPMYMCPQALKKNQYSYKSDIWSLGVMYYELLYGVTPWTATTEQELAYKLTNSPVVFPKTPQVSELSKNFIKKCLDVNESTRLGPEELDKHPLIQQSVQKDKQKQHQQKQQEQEYLKQQQLKQQELEKQQQQLLQQKQQQQILTNQQLAQEQKPISEPSQNQVSQNSSATSSVDDVNKVIAQVQSQKSNQPSQYKLQAQQQQQNNFQKSSSQPQQQLPPQSYNQTSTPVQQDVLGKENKLGQINKPTSYNQQPQTIGTKSNSQYQRAYQNNNSNTNINNNNQQLQDSQNYGKKSDPQQVQLHREQYVAPQTSYQQQDVLQPTSNNYENQQQYSAKKMVNPYQGSYTIGQSDDQYVKQNTNNKSPFLQKPQENTYKDNSSQQNSNSSTGTSNQNMLHEEFMQNDMIILAQINFCRFLVRLQKLTEEFSNLETPFLKERIIFFILKNVMCKITKLKEMCDKKQNLFYLSNFQSYIQNDSFKKFIIVINEYYVKYQTLFDKYDNQIFQKPDIKQEMQADSKFIAVFDRQFLDTESFYQNLQIFLRYSIHEINHVIKTHLKDEPEKVPNSIEGSIVLLDYMVTYFQLAQLILDRFTDFSFFAQASKIEQIAEGRPVRLTKSHFAQIRNKIYSLEI